jgi:hypothetical protein
MVKSRYKEDRGGLYKVRERKSAKSPHAMGEANIGGKLYFIAAWTKVNEYSGEKYMNLVFREKPEEE